MVDMELAESISVLMYLNFQQLAFVITPQKPVITNIENLPQFAVRGQKTL